ncbi:MAG: hypothetical protein E7291_05940 [Lachnospiraceae bacterium]|nr:hypothetical protein [Lachnospiraceae bacterium]
MENKRTLLDFMSFVMRTFGICICFLLVLTMMANAEMIEITSMFIFGNNAISITILLQFLLLSFITSILVFLFTSAYMIRFLSLTTRLILMPVSIILCLGITIYFFDWFPAGAPLPWILFMVSFLICFGISVAITLHKNKKADDDLNKALEKMK